MNSPYNEIRLKNVPEKVKQEFANISSHTNVSIPDLIKSNLHKITESFPAALKQSPAKKD